MQSNKVLANERIYIDFSHLREYTLGTVNHNISVTKLQVKINTQKEGRRNFLLKVYTAKEAAEVLKLTPNTIKKMVKDGRLKGSFITDGRRSIRVTEEAIREFLANTQRKEE